MKRIVIAFIAGIILVTAAACPRKPQDGTATGKKIVADQRLALYHSIRRLLFKDACGSAGQVTVCVETIVISDTATVVETRIKNDSGHACLYGYAPGVAVLQTKDPDETFELHSADPWTSVEPGEKTWVFRGDGHLQGSPALFTVNRISETPVDIPPEQSKSELSIMVQLDADR